MTFTIPGKCPSASNLREHWATKAKRVKEQRARAMYYCSGWKDGPLLVVELVRVSPRQLDSHDNLRHALKGYVDGVAARMRIDDGSPLVSWRYAQEKCPEGQECVRVVIRPAGMGMEEWWDETLL